MPLHPARTRVRVAALGVGLLLGIDIGGTFTDFVLLDEGRIQIHKVLTTVHDRSVAFMAGVRELGAERDGRIVHGSTVATNALLERKGARTVLVTTAGFGDVVEIGRQNRAELYSLQPRRPEPLVPRDRRVEAVERLDYRGRVLRALTGEEADRVGEAVRSLQPEAVAVVLLFSFLDDAHERRLGEAIAAALGDTPVHVSLSSEVLPEYREYERTSTTVINAYVSPAVAHYLGRIEHQLGRPFSVMQSGGGVASAASTARLGVHTILSGPAGGVTGAFAVARRAGYDQVISFDMGGTSTDVALCPGYVQRTFEGEIAGLPVRVPMLDVHTVGAGGGSLARVDVGGALLVGPESAGADPGPACYGTGSAVTVTDANLALGRLDAGHFLGGHMKLDQSRMTAALDRLAADMGSDRETAAAGVLRIANANMEAAIRRISVERGFDPRSFTLVAFGGAGPLHACELAAELRIPRVLVPLYPGVLSAFGMLTADVQKDYSRSALARVDAAMSRDVLEGWYRPLVDRGLRDMEAEGFAAAQVRLDRLLDLRYHGQSYELTVAYDPDAGVAAAVAAFHQAHQQRFGHADPASAVEIVTVRLRALGQAEQPPFVAEQPEGNDASEAIIGEKQVYFGGWLATRLFDRGRLRPGNRFAGPAIVFQFDTTTVIPPGWEADVDSFRNLVLARTFA